MKTKIVTSIYSDLHGTEFGGRPSRGGHYRHSLLSLMKMSDADFVCYTSEREFDDLVKFFYLENNVDKNKLIFKKYDISNFSLSDKINKIKNIEDTKHSDRCVEIQYCKFIWCIAESDIGNYDNLYWFDAGLSHSGLFPYRHMDQSGYWQQNYHCYLLDNKFLSNLITFTGDNIFVCAKENQMNYWSGTVPREYYTEYCMDRHIIGGFFGGKTQNMKKYCDLFLEYTHKLLDKEPRLYFEENIMTLMFYNHKEMFAPKYFDIWWHENDKMDGLDLHEYTKTRKSFYKIIEELRDAEHIN